MSRVVDKSVPRELLAREGVFKTSHAGEKSRYQASASANDVAVPADLQPASDRPSIYQFQPFRHLAPHVQPRSTLSSLTPLRRLQPQPGRESFQSSSDDEDALSSDSTGNEVTTGNIRRPINYATGVKQGTRKVGKRVRFKSPLVEVRKMSVPKRPSLKLNFSGVNRSDTDGAAQSPNPQSAVRTPSLKLKFNSASTPTPQLKIKTSGPNAASPDTASAKKRKRDAGEVAPASGQARRKLTLKTSLTPTTAQTPKTPAIFKLKTKGKVPKRPLGVGYDSELEDREVDPVILEAFVLRMMEDNEDCAYIRNAVQSGTVGIHHAQGGADIRMRFFDTAGRRGIIIINGHQYATSVVDLPTVIEGMKSWDKKAWIKSVDICQMMLVLGRVTNDEEAKTFPLPDGVDPKTYAYPHGLTAPMKWVRRRRFARTRRARVDDIESIERKVAQLLEADRAAVSTTYQILDHDPRQDEFSPEEDSDQDAEGEVDEDYFAPHSGYTNGTGATPALVGAEPANIRQDEIDEFEQAFADDDEEAAAAAAAAAVNGHNARLPGDNSLAVTERDSSGAVSPAAATSASAAPTPAGEADDDDDDESDADADSDRDEEEKDADDNVAQVKERITDIETKIREQTAQLKKTTNAILKRKIAGKIQALQDDVLQMKKSIGLADEDEDDDG